MKKRIIGVILIVILLIITIPFVLVYHNLSSVGKNEEKVFIIENGTSTIKVISDLKENGLIRDVFSTKVYAYLTKPSIKAGKYKINNNMSTMDIFKMLTNGDVINENIKITFKEGKRITNYASLINEHFNISEDEIYNKLKDTTYLNSLIDKYWFITDDILNNDIYYSLEGFLYPDTYEFDKDASIEDIFGKMIDEMSLKLEPFKERIENDNRSFYDILKMASLVENEASSYEDRKEVAGIFYNRIKYSMTLGSDVTTYYAARKEFTQELSEAELNDCNKYNTRSTCLLGLPVSPISSVSITSIDAVINYNDTDNYFFVADKNKKLYFSKNNSEHQRTITTLKSEDLWYNY